MLRCWFVLSCASVCVAFAPALVFGEDPRLIQEVAQLAPNDLSLGRGQGFGASVAIDGDWIAVGAPGDDHFWPNSGSVYVFRRVGASWIQQDKVFGLLIPGGDTGHSVAMSGDWIVAGAPAFSDQLGPPSGFGHVYVYRRNDNGTPDVIDDYWPRVAVLTAPPSHVCCNFGLSVDIEGDVIAVGSLARQRAYPFRWDGSEWLHDGTLVGGDSQELDSFGTVVATNGEVIAVTAVPDRDSGAASVYVFGGENGVWVQHDILNADDIEPQSLLGQFVAVSADHLAVGANGSAYVFESDGGDWRAEANVRPIPNWNNGGFAGAIALGDRKLVGGSNGPVWAHVFQPCFEGWCEVFGLEGPATGRARAMATNDRYVLVGPRIYAVGEALSLSDYAEFQRCFGSGEPPPLACAQFDLEPDGRIDLTDQALLLQTFRGP